MNNLCDKAQALALQKFTKPRKTRFFYALLRWGWVVVLATAFLLTGCADDLEMHAATQADLADAIAQAAKEAGQ